MQPYDVCHSGKELAGFVGVMNFIIIYYSRIRNVLKLKNKLIYKKQMAKIQNSSFKFHHFLFQYSKFIFVHFNPLNLKTP